MPQLVLVRHAAATGQENNAGLSVAGARQASALAEFLSSLGTARVISSPAARAIQSIEPFCKLSGLPVEVDSRLAERVLSGADQPDWRDNLRQSFDDLDRTVEGGESSRSAQERGLAVAREALALGGRSILMTHGNLLALTLNSIDPAFGFEDWSRLSNPDVFLIDAEGSRPARFLRIWPPNHRELDG